MLYKGSIATCAVLIQALKDGKARRGVFNGASSTFLEYQLIEDRYRVAVFNLGIATLRGISPLSAIAVDQRGIRQGRRQKLGDDN